MTNALPHLERKFPGEFRAANRPVWPGGAIRPRSGGFRYSARLDKGKKYLLETEAKVDGGTRSVRHSIGGQHSTHELTRTPSLISAVISPAEPGWINGMLRQDHSNPPDYWYVYYLTLRELD